MPKLRQAVTVLPFALVLLLLGAGTLIARAQEPERLLLPSLHAPPAGHIMIAAAHIDSALTGEADEAILLWNAAPTPVDLAGWTLEVNGRRTAFPITSTLTLPSGGRGWCTAQAALFQI